MDWFEKLVGFRETEYSATLAQLECADQMLRSRVKGKTYAVGDLELVSLAELRDRAAAADLRGTLKVSVHEGEARELHRAPEYAGALFQVASQFNLLEMITEHVTPEKGLTIYQGDKTQGPACAIAAGAATIFRNYFVPVGGARGQTADRQLDGLADLGAALSEATGLPAGSLWTMTNGYALATGKGLDAIAKHLKALAPEQIDLLRGKLRIGVHSDVEVTDMPDSDRHKVTQAFCSALPVGYSELLKARWAPFAQLVLEAAYEATMWAAVLNAHRRASNIVLLTLLGGGAFGNRPEWIYAAIRRALALTADFDLDVRLISYRSVPSELVTLAREFSPAHRHAAP